MSNRRALAVMAGLVLLLGLVLAALPVRLDVRQDGERVACGTALSGVSAGAESAARVDDLLGSMGGITSGADLVAECEDSINTRRLIAFPLAGVGALSLLFLGLTRRSTTADEPSASRSQPAPH